MFQYAQKSACNQKGSLLVSFLHSKWLRVLALFVVAAFVLPYITFAFETSTYHAPLAQASNRMVTALNGTGFKLAPEQGRVLSSYQGHANKTVVFIHDLHCNYEVQNNIAAILDELARNHGLQMVGIEGESKPVNVQQISTLPVPDVRNSTAQYFLKRGRITGAEFLASTASRPLSLVGIEDQRLYDLNKKTVAKFLNEQSQSFCDDLRAALGRLKTVIYPVELAKLDHYKRQYEDETVNLETYCDSLLGEARRQNVELDTLPVMNMFAATHKLPSGPDTDYDRLLSDARALDRDLRERLYTAVEQRQLDRYLKIVQITDDMLNISATAAELEYFRTHPRDFALKPMLGFIHTLAKQNAVEVDIDTEIMKLEEYLKLAAYFYDIADQRSDAFVRNILRYMEEKNQKLAAVIIGGFHASQVEEILQTRNISYVTIKPRVTRTYEENPYFSLLRNKRAPLEKLLAKKEDLFAPASAFNDAVTKAYIDFVAKLGLRDYLYNIKGLRGAELKAAEGQAMNRYLGNTGNVRLDLDNILANPAEKISVFKLLGTPYSVVLRPSKLSYPDEKVVVTTEELRTGWSFQFILTKDLKKHTRLILGTDSLQSLKLADIQALLAEAVGDMTSPLAAWVGSAGVAAAGARTAKAGRSTGFGTQTVYDQAFVGLANMVATFDQTVQAFGKAAEGTLSPFKGPADWAGSGVGLAASGTIMQSGSWVKNFSLSAALRSGLFNRFSGFVADRLPAAQEQNWLLTVMNLVGGRFRQSGLHPVGADTQKGEALAPEEESPIQKALAVASRLGYSVPLARNTLEAGLIKIWEQRDAMKEILANPDRHEAGKVREARAFLRLSATPKGLAALGLAANQQRSAVAGALTAETEDDVRVLLEGEMLADLVLDSRQALSELLKNLPTGLVQGGSHLAVLVRAMQSGEPCVLGQATATPLENQLALTLSQQQMLAMQKLLSLAKKKSPELLIQGPFQHVALGFRPERAAAAYRELLNQIANLGPCTIKVQAELQPEDQAALAAYAQEHAPAVKLDFGQPAAALPTEAAEAPKPETAAPDVRAAEPQAQVQKAPDSAEAEQPQGFKLPEIEFNLDLPSLNLSGPAGGVSAFQARLRSDSPYQGELDRQGKKSLPDIMTAVAQTGESLTVELPDIGRVNLQVDGDLLKAVGREALPRIIREAVQTRGPDLFQELDGKPITIALLDKSTHLFENHTRDHFIGVNAAVLAAIGDPEIREAILKVGMTHELRHEAGEMDETKLTAEDSALLLKLLPGRWSDAVQQLQSLVAGEGFLSRLLEDARAQKTVSRQDFIAMLEPLRKQAQDAGAEFAATVAPGDFVLDAAPEKIRGLLTRLLQEQLKGRPRKIEITISPSAAGGQLQISVRAAAEGKAAPAAAAGLGTLAAELKMMSGRLTLAMDEEQSVLAEISLPLARDSRQHPAFLRDAAVTEPLTAIAPETGPAAARLVPSAPGIRKDVEQYFRVITAGVPWELVKRAFLTLGVLAAYTVGRGIVVPGIGPAATGGSTALDIFNFFSGGALNQMSVFGLGLAPYFTAWMIIQTLTFVIPRFKELQRSGELGQHQLARYARWLTVGVAVVQAAFAVHMLPLIFGTLALQLSGIVALTLGAVAMSWFQQQVQEKGLGGKTGSALLAFMMLQSMLASGGSLLLGGGALAMGFMPYLITALALLGLAVGLQSLYVKLPLRSAYQADVKTRLQAASRFLPFKIQNSGLFALYYSAAFVALANMLAVPLMGMSITPNGLAYTAVTGVLILGYTLLSAALFMHPEELARNLSRGGNYIPGVAPGRETRALLKKTIMRIGLASGAVTALFALTPQILGFGDLGVACMILVASSVGMLRQAQAMLAAQRAAALNQARTYEAGTPLGRLLPYLVPAAALSVLVGAWYQWLHAGALAVGAVTAVLHLGAVSWLFIVGTAAIIGAHLLYAGVLKAGLRERQMRQRIAALRIQADQVDDLRAELAAKSLPELRQEAERLRQELAGRSGADTEKRFQQARLRAMALAATVIEKQKRASAALETNLERQQLLEHFTLHPNQILAALAFTDRSRPEGLARISRGWQRLFNPAPVEDIAGYAVKIKTGQGKTEAAALALFAVSLLGQGAHLMTPNIGLAVEQGQDMQSLLGSLGVSIGITGIFDRESGSPQAMVWDPARNRFVVTDNVAAAYAADITYGTETAFNFDYQMGRLEREPFFRIDDEGDVTYFVEGTTPRIITLRDQQSQEQESRQAGKLADMAQALQPGMLTVDLASQELRLTEAGRQGPYAAEFESIARNNPVFYRLVFAEWVSRLRQEETTSGNRFFEVNYKAQEEMAELTDQGRARTEAFLGLPAGTKLSDFPSLQYFLRASLDATFYYQSREGREAAAPGVAEYDLVESPGTRQISIVLINDATGNQMPGQEVSHGIHQALQAKEYLAHPDTAFRSRIRFSDPVQSQSALLPAQFARRYPWRNLMSATPSEESAEDEELASRLGLERIDLPSDQGPSLFRGLYPDQYYLHPQEQAEAIAEVVARHRLRAGILLAAFKKQKNLALAGILPKVLAAKGMTSQVLGPQTDEKQLPEIVAQAQERARQFRSELDQAGKIGDAAQREAAQAEIGGRYRQMTICVINSQTTDAQMQAIKSIAALPLVVTITNGRGGRGYNVLAENMLLIKAEIPNSEKSGQQVEGRVGRQGLVGYVVDIFSFADDEIFRKYIPEFLSGLLAENLTGNLKGTRWGDRIIQQIYRTHQSINRTWAEARNYFEQYMRVVDAADVQRRQFARQVAAARTPAELTLLLEQAFEQDLGRLVAESIRLENVRATLRDQAAELIRAHTPYRDPALWPVQELRAQMQSLLPEALDDLLASLQVEAAQPQTKGDSLRNRWIRACEYRINELPEEAIGQFGFSRLLQALSDRGVVLDQASRAQMFEAYGQACSQPESEEAGQFEAQLQTALQMIYEPLLADGRIPLEELRQSLLQGIQESWGEFLEQVQSVREEVAYTSFIDRDPVVEFNLRANQLRQQYFFRVLSEKFTMIALRAAFQALAGFSQARPARRIAVSGQEPAAGVQRRQKPAGQQAAGRAGGLAFAFFAAPVSMPSARTSGEQVQAPQEAGRRLLAEERSAVQESQLLPEDDAELYQAALRGELFQISGDRLEGKLPLEWAAFGPVNEPAIIIRYNREWGAEEMKYLQQVAQMFNSRARVLLIVTEAPESAGQHEQQIQDVMADIRQSGAGRQFRAYQLLADASLQPLAARPTLGLTRRLWMSVRSNPVGIGLWIGLAAVVFYNWIQGQPVEGQVLTQAAGMGLVIARAPQVQNPVLPTAPGTAGPAAGLPQHIAAQHDFARLPEAMPSGLGRWLQMVRLRAAVTEIGNMFPRSLNLMAFWATPLQKMDAHARAGFTGSTWCGMQSMPGGLIAWLSTVAALGEALRAAVIRDILRRLSNSALTGQDVDHALDYLAELPGARSTVFVSTTSRDGVQTERQMQLPANLLTNRGWLIRLLNIRNIKILDRNRERIVIPGMRRSIGSAA